MSVTVPSENHDSTGTPLPPSWLPVEHWATLKGQTVEISIDGTVTDRGRVDDVMPDGSNLWLAHDGAITRRIVPNQPGTSIRVDPG